MLLPQKSQYLKMKIAGRFDMEFLPTLVYLKHLELYNVEICYLNLGSILRE